MSETTQEERSGLQRAAEPAMSIPGHTAVDRLTSIAGELWSKVSGLPTGKRTWLMASITFIAAVAIAMVWYAGRKDWRMLFTGLDGRDAQQVSQELASAGIPYQMTPDGGGIQVPAEMLDKARMEVAARGMPQTGRMGFELFDKPNWVGSEFDERVNYQRALEGELEHTISTLGVVRSARVHLVLPKQSLFTNEERAAKASVVLKLKRPTLGEEQADAIRSLVAGAVENLSPDDVNLVDADGRANLKPRSKGVVAAEVEQGMESKLVAMLEPLAGRDNVRATVNVSYEQGSEERTDEIYDPTQSAALSLQKSEQVSQQAQRAMGVPGTASNSPAGAPEGAVQGSQAAAAPGTPPLLQKQALPVYPQQGAGAGQSLREENGTYGVTKHTLHSEEGPGRVRRITAAIVVNDRNMVEGSGKTQHAVWKPRNAEEMRRLQELAQAAVGFDARRGDQVVVENVSFSSNAPEIKSPVIEQVMEQARSFARSQPSLGRTAIFGLCAILLVLCVLRPMARQVVATLREPALLPAGSERGMNEIHPGLPAVDEVNPFALPSKTKEQLQHQGVFERVADHIRREPVQSTRLLEAWIGSTEEMD
ncbi:flagellar basal-body MS-ring/collar protein FliF [Edaphobacter albus]|uniref:flagellar basal-body MS-ring/collar protein FliF n=1 Tax=Edaphobacter sp. 4G125 TaxID=2763071 RepID=UPI00164773DF|nr:flagellar basal-body MS-ring/collar protein FliF [Edaphobacter sp. 4G125]QNI35267.1 flagellar M-ring protein FliF [Edaphobacter sp. 4G125]